MTTESTQTDEMSRTQLFLRGTHQIDTVFPSISSSSPLSPRADIHRAWSPSTAGDLWTEYHNLPRTLWAKINDMLHRCGKDVPKTWKWKCQALNGDGLRKKESVGNANTSKLPGHHHNHVCDSRANLTEWDGCCECDKPTGGCIVDLTAPMIIVTKNKLRVAGLAWTLTSLC